jgi:hypothetical protein
MTDANYPALRSRRDRLLTFRRGYSIPSLCHSRAMRQPYLVIDASLRSCKYRPIVPRIVCLFLRSASPRNKALVDGRLSLRSAALAILGLSLLGWGALLFWVVRWLSHS